MVALLITSRERSSGKTAIGAGLGKHLLTQGKKVGFFKPLIADSAPEETDSDAVLMKHLFALEEPIDLLCPLFSHESELTSRIKDAYARVSHGKDVVIIEGMTEQASRTIAEALDARVIIVESYSKEPLKPLESGDFGERLLGLVVNKVPKNRLQQVRSELANLPGEVSLLGVLPEDRTLFALSIAELANHIHSETIVAAGKPGELLENLMLGALSIDPGPLYFARKANKAVIVKSERPDIQLAALETSTRCLVLTGNMPLKPIVRQRAEEKKTAILLAKDEPLNLIAHIEDALSKTRFTPEKLPRLMEMMEQHFDFPKVFSQ